MTYNYQFKLFIYEALKTLNNNKIKEPVICFYDYQIEELKKYTKINVEYDKENNWWIVTSALPLKRKCSLCGKMYTGMGHHTKPIKKGGFCCDKCFKKLVEPARLKKKVKK